MALARAEMDQGLTNITPDMVAELEAHVDDINYEVAIEREKLVRHDVMSHVYAYGQQCPKAAGIIHLGATSCYVGDNTDIIVMRQGLELVELVMKVKYNKMLFIKFCPINNHLKENCHVKYDIVLCGLFIQYI